MMKFLNSFILASFTLSLISCQQNGSKNSAAVTYQSKLNFSYERYYLRKAECDIKDSSFIKDSAHKIESILSKVEKKATQSKANWVVITGLGEGAVSDHYFFEAYHCDKKQNDQVVTNLGDVNHNLKFVQSDIKRLDDSLVKRHYPTFQLYLRSKLGQ